MKFHGHQIIHYFNKNLFLQDFMLVYNKSNPSNVRKVS